MDAMMKTASAMAERLKAFHARADLEGMSDARRDLEMRRVGWGKNPPNDFLLDNGRDYAFSEASFAGERAEAQQCYQNATHLALMEPELTYVEGNVWVFGVAIGHAWCADADGNVIDPTLVIGEGSDIKRIGAYYGVPFKTEYLRKAVLWNKVYGLLDYFSAPLTVAKLYELGHEAGQQWLLDQKKKPVRKRKAKK